MTSPLREQIERIGREIARTESELADLVRAAESDADGKVTPEDEEYEDILQARKELKEARRLLKAKEDEFARNRSEWEGLAGEVGELWDRVRRMEDFGIDGIAVLSDRIAEAEAAGADERYREACDIFAAAQTSAQSPWQEYEEQSEAKAEFDAERPQVDTAVEAIRGAGVTSDMLTAALSQIETNLTSADAMAETRDYKEALALLRLGNPEVAGAEAEVSRLQAEKDAAEQALQAVRDKMDEIQPEAAEFEQLAERIDAVPGGIADAERMIAEGDFANVQNHIGTLDYELDAIRATIPVLRAEQEAEAARIEAERQRWDQAAPRWSEVQDKLRELTEWRDEASAQVGHFADAVQGHVDAEEFQLALDALGQAEQALEEPWQNHQAQVAARDTYEATRPALEQRVADAGAHPHMDDAARQQLAQAEAALSRMADLAGAMDYVAANDETEGLSGALDALEQTLRENQARAEAAEALGADPNTSNAEVEAEANRRLYEEERDVVQRRLNDALDTGVRGADIEAALGQIQTNLTSIAATADTGDYGQALEDIRGQAAEMGRIEELIRDRAELKARFEAALAELRSDADRLAASELMTVSDAAGHALNTLDEAQTMADEGRYEEALRKVRTGQTELGDAERRGAELAALKAEAESRLAALRPRLDAAAQNAYPEIQPAADAVTRAADSVNALLEREEFETALEEIDALVTLVELYETEEESAHGYQRYQDALATLDLDNKIRDMNDSEYPETGEERLSVEEADIRRLAHEADGEWSEARAAAYETSERLGLFSAKQARIESAKASYESEAPAMIAAAEKVSTEGQADDTGAIARWETTLAGIRSQMETAAGENRWLAALEAAEEFGANLRQAEIELRDLFQAPDSVIFAHVRQEAMNFANAIVPSMMNGAMRFEVWVLERIEAERTTGKVMRYVGYGADLAGAVASALDKTGIVSGIIGGIKLVTEVTADVQDDIADDADRAAGRQLCAEIRAQIASIEGQFNVDMGPWLKANDPDAFKEIGNRLYNDDPSGATVILEGLGLKIEDSRSAISDSVFEELKSKFRVIRE